MDPASGLTYGEGDIITFIGLAGDTEDEPEALTTIFTSDIDGLLGTASPDADGLATLEASLSPGTHLVSFVVTDSASAEASAMAALNINAKPTVPSIHLEPDNPNTTHDLEVIFDAESTDPDGSPVYYLYEWTCDGESRPYIPGTIAESLWTLRDETWVVTVTATDGHTRSDPATATVVIGNAPPTLDGVVITPAEPTLDSTLLCEPDGFNDADMDEDHSTVSWWIGGEEVGTEATLSDVFSGDDVVLCSITANDGIEDGNTVESTVTIGNAAPSITVAEWSPATDLQTNDVLTITAEAIDPDGDMTTVNVMWFVDDIDVGIDALSLDGSTHFDKDQAITAVVFPTDGETEGAAVVLGPITVINSPPSIADVTISPEAPRAGDTLTCSATYSDPDSDPSESTVVWTVGGVMLGTDWTLPGVVGKGVEATCTVTAHDGTEAGNSDSASTTIQNTAPTVLSASLSPTDPHTDDPVTVSVTVDDTDPIDIVTHSTAWLVNGTPVPASGDTLDGSYFAKGNTITAAVTASDGTDESEPLLTESVTVLNTQPSIESVTVEPSEVRAGDTVNCTAGALADIDGDGVTPLISWTIDGTEVGTESSISSGFYKGDTLTCTITPYDGESAGDAMSASTTVVNTPPSVGLATLSPDPLTTADTPSCVSEGTTDADGDAITMAYTWSINGAAPVPGSADLDATLTSGDTVQCAITPSDDDESGETATSEVLTVTGSSPEVISLMLAPETVRTDDILTAYVATSDYDGDPVSIGYRWEVNGVEVPITTSELDGVDWFDKGDTVTVFVTPSDSDSSGDTETASRVVANSAPGTPLALIEPELVRAGMDDAQCAYVFDSADDPDGASDLSGVEVTWEFDGEPWAGETLMTDWPGDTLPATATEIGDEWTCILRIYDGEEYSAVTTASFTAMNWTYSEDFSDCGDSSCGGSWIASGSHYVSGGVLVSQYNDYGYIYHDLTADLGGPVQGDKWIFQFDIRHTLASAGSSCSAAQSFMLTETVFGEWDGVSDMTGGVFQDYRGFQQYWQFYLRDDDVDLGTVVHYWMTEMPPSDWRTFTVIRDGDTITMNTDGRIHSNTVSDDFGDNFGFLKLRDHYSSNCNPSTRVEIDNIEIRLGETSL